MTNRTVMPLTLAVLLAAGGCLQKETSHTLYLSPDGGVTWAVSDSNVYSDEAEVGKRIQEEQQFMGRVLLGTHETARGFAALRPIGVVRTTVVRDERPFHVITEARFDRIDRMFERLLTKAGIKATSSFVTSADGAALHVRLHFDEQLEADEAVNDLLDVQNFRFVLTEGQFGDSTGFDVNGPTATFSRDWVDRADTAYEERREIEFALTWTLH